MGHRRSLRAAACKAFGSTNGCCRRFLAGAADFIHRVPSTRLKRSSGMVPCAELGSPFADLHAVTRGVVPVTIPCREKACCV